MAGKLDGKRIAILATDGVEEVELTRPRDAVTAEGARVDVVSIDDGDLQAMTHDIERMFPGGPRLDHATTEWDSPFYLYPHSLRSAESVGVWLGSIGPAAATLRVWRMR